MISTACETKAPLRPAAQIERTVSGRKPRLGFLGVGWIGRSRMEAMARSGCGEIAGIADAVSDNAAQALSIAPGAQTLPSIEELLGLGLDGIVIATPSALHARQAIAALEQGVAVFCQKPLARTAPETTRVIDAARANDCLLGVDLSYRFTAGIRELRQVIRFGELGRLFAVDLIFHNAYGPDKAWFYDARLSGGGCMMDLGIHLVDLVLWVLDYPAIDQLSSRLFSGGADWNPNSGGVEDYATARLDLATGPAVNLACSWRLQAGCDAIIRAAFYGTNGGVEFTNVNGSFYDFRAERFFGTRRETLASGPDDWSGRAAVDWLKRLAEGGGYDPAVEGLVQVAATLDRLYGRA